jgi:RimJ/RimL family protein N-acetyltransferase
VDPVGEELLRRMTPADVGAVLEIQEPASVAALAGVFPQDAYPFPRDEVGRRWRQEVADPGVDCFVVAQGLDVVGFAATRRDELLHFGIALDRWGSGLGGRAHDEVLGRLAERGVQRAWLTVFTGNARGRRFYEKNGWEATGERTHSEFPPHPELLRYERVVDQGPSTEPTVV